MKESLFIYLSQVVLHSHCNESYCEYPLVAIFQRLFGYTEGEFNMANSPNLYIFGVWEETGAPGGNPHRHGENVQTLHR